MQKAILPILLVIGLLALVIMKKGAIFLLLALLPAFMAYFIDSHPSKSVFKTVLACNFAATLPTLMPLLQAGLRMQPNTQATAAMTDPMTWLFIYGGAAAGWCLVFLCRIISRFILTVSYEFHIVALERSRKRLLEEWGQKLKEFD